LTTLQEEIICNHVIVAAGAWSAQIGKMLDISIPVRPVRGEMIALKPFDQPHIHHILFDEGVFDINVYISPSPTVVDGSAPSASLPRG
jgi:glycine/D-amino acid oxidase-like deaminating enzyme